MNKTKQSFVFGFALFAGFFGAGNLVLPPLLGFNSGADWWLVSLGFIISTTIIPMLALFGHAKLQGTLLEFGNKVSPLFSLSFCLFIYVIIIALPSPRTAAVTHEMAVAPFFDTSPLLTSVIYFSLAFVFVINRGNALQILGKYLTPIIVVILLTIILVGLFYPVTEMKDSVFKTPIISGLLEGYQTYDALAAMVMGGIVIVSINNFKEELSFKEKRMMIAKSGFIAITGLFVIYAGLIATGASFSSQFPEDISRTGLLSGLASKTLGNIGAISLSILVGLACFSTAVAIIISTADFFKALFKGSQKVYVLVTIICCLTGVLVGQFEVSYIIDIALPVLALLYPTCIVLILLHAISGNYASRLVFRWVVITVLIFSVPDFLNMIVPNEILKNILSFMPFGQQNLGWILPALIVFIAVNLFEKFTANKKLNVN
jgi:LIVCS family branched-chain amino acid:cation transporter